MGTTRPRDTGSFDGPGRRRCPADLGAVRYGVGRRILRRPPGRAPDGAGRVTVRRGVRGAAERSGVVSPWSVRLRTPGFPTVRCRVGLRRVWRPLRPRRLLQLVGIDGRIDPVDPECRTAELARLPVAEHPRAASRTDEDVSGHGSLACDHRRRACTTGDGAGPIPRADAKRRSFAFPDFTATGQLFMSDLVAVRKGRSVRGARLPAHRHDLRQR